MSCLDDFESNIGEVLAVAAHSASLLRGPSATDRVVANAMTRAGLVLLCGYVEGFLRDLVSESIERVNGLGFSPGEFPLELLGALIDDVADTSGSRRQTELARLKSALDGISPFELSGKRISSTGGNPTVDVVEGMLAVFGVCHAIDRLSIEHFGVDSTFTVEAQSASLAAQFMSVVDGDVTKVDALLTAVDAKWLPRKRRRNVGYVHSLQELLKRRHRVAHGEGKDPVTPGDLENAAGEMHQLCRGLHSLLSSRLDEISLLKAGGGVAPVVA